MRSRVMVRAFYGDLAKRLEFGALRILTFDLEDWFHLVDGGGCGAVAESRVEAMADRLLSLLAETHQVATFFCLGEVAALYPALIRRIAEAGHDVACHSYSHLPLSAMDPLSFREDLRRALGTLRDCTGKQVTAYRAPGFSLTRAATWAIDILLDEGIETDASVFPVTWGKPDLGGMMNAPFRVRVAGRILNEFPMNVRRFGLIQMRLTGGYFRALPYPVLGHLLRDSDYAMTCFHPRDFDAELPLHSGIGMVRRFKLRLGLSSSFEKLHRLLVEFKFMSLRAAFEQVDWDKAPVLRVKEAQDFSIEKPFSASSNTRNGKTEGSW